MRRRNLALIALALLLFLAVSALLARVFSADGAERSAITSLIRAEARGEQSAMVRQIDGCGGAPACRARVAQNASRLKRPGTVSIIQIQSSAGFSLSGTLGMARVAWNAGGSLPVVQCVQVRRAGSALSGLRIELLGITAKLQGDASCPKRIY